MQKKIEAGLSLGTNLGDRLASLSEAKRRIAALSELEIVVASPVYETDPVGVKPEYQHLKFLNAVLIVQGTCPPHECFDRLREIENEMGRKRSLDQFALRPIDIDLIYAGDMKIQSGGLIVPHPHWSERRFVVQPLADVRPALVLPGSVKTVAEILRDLASTEKVVKYADTW